MMMHRTIFIKAMLAFALAAALAACSTAPPPAQKTGISIRYQDWRLAEEPSASVLTKMVNEFMAANPDVKVQLEPVASGDKVNKFVTQARGGNPPDVVKVLTTDLPSYKAMGFVLNLDPYIAKAGGQAYKDQFMDFLGKAVAFNGSWYGMPHEGDAFLLYINSRLWQAAGLDPKRPPKTFEELKAANRKLTAASSGRYAFGMLAQPAISAIWMQSWFTANGADFFNADYTDTTIDSPMAIKAFKFYTDMVTKDKVVPPGATQVDYAAEITLFSQEKVAYIQGPFATQGNILSANPNLKPVLQAIPFPGTKATAGRGSVFAISHASKNPDAAWRFIEFMNSEQNQLRYYNEAKMMPTKKPALAKVDVSADPIAKTMIQEAIPAAKSYPITAKWPKIKPILDDVLGNTLLGKSDPEAAMKGAATQIRAVLKEQ
jgi:ABC-type glycerol-3-phosphate transport system substrate-binding protein